MVKTDFWEVLSATQQYISKNYAQALTVENKNEDLRYFIEKFVIDCGFLVEGYTDAQLIDRLYSEMVEYSILTPYLGHPDLDEININSWDDITLNWSDGRIEKLKEHFRDPSHAVDIVKRLLHHSGMIIDNAKPLAQGLLPNNTRITAIKTPIVDECCGISASIRLLHPQRIDRKCIIESGMATEEMIEFLESCIRYGTSELVVGRTNSGKTTLVNALLASIPDNKRIYSLESGARELFLVKKNEKGEIQNNVVHTISRQSENSSFNVSQENLVEAALRFDPDLIVVGEVRDAEAHATVEASLTGHTVITTVHSGPAESAHARVSLLCQRRFQLGMQVSLEQVRQAFPIIAYCTKCEDNNRRVTDISECSVTPDGVARYRCLYRYHITENVCENGHCRVEGRFEKVNSPSAYLQTLLIRNGIPYQTLEKFIRKEDRL